MKYHIKRLFNGKASVRDYQVKECMDKKQNLILTNNGQEMIIPWQDLHLGKEDPHVHSSKFGIKRYKLIDFMWEPTNKDQQKLF